MGLQSWQFASLSLHLLPLVWILVSGTFSPCVAKMPLHSSRITSFLFHWIYWGDIGSQNHTGFKCTTQQKHHHHTASFFVAFDARKREGRDRESDPFFFCQTATLIQENILTSSAWILNSLLRSVTREKGSHNQFSGNGDQTSNTGMTDRQFTQGGKKRCYISRRETGCWEVKTTDVNYRISTFTWVRWFRDSGSFKNLRYWCNTYFWNINFRPAPCNLNAK